MRAAVDAHHGGGVMVSGGDGSAWWCSIKGERGGSRQRALVASGRRVRHDSM
jgi:hypothetical protein